MALYLGRQITLCGLQGIVSKQSYWYHINHPTDGNSTYFKKIGFNTKEEKKALYKEVVGYFEEGYHFPPARTLDDLENIVNKMNTIFDRSDSLVSELVDKIIARPRLRIGGLYRHFLQKVHAP